MERREFLKIALGVAAAAAGIVAAIGAGVTIKAGLRAGFPALTVLGRWVWRPTRTCQTKTPLARGFALVRFASLNKPGSVRNARRCHKGTRAREAPPRPP